MHQPIRDSLEDYLSGLKHRIPQAFHAHLETCEQCANELRGLENQSSVLHSFQCETDIEPATGFYTRVMDRIDDQAGSSIWLPLLDPRFGRRLAVAAAALVVLLATYLVTSERGGFDISAPADVVMTAPSSDAAVQSDSAQQQHQRDAVLVDLASYHE